MKLRSLTVAVCCVTFASATSAADGKAKKPAAKPPAKSTKSSMIKIPPPSDDEGERGEPTTLITTELNGRDIQALNSAVETGLLQAYLGELAKAKAATDDVKQLGNLLYAKQRDENRQLERIASLKGLVVPHTAPAQQKTIAAELDPLNGPKFDKACLEKMVSVNEQAVAAYETAAESPDGDIKALAEGLLPIARQKLQIINKIAGNPTKPAGAPSFRTQSQVAPP
jgi:predicted outer membrane protein